MMNLKNMKDAAKRVFGRGSGSLSLLRRFGALALALCLLASVLPAAYAGSETGGDGSDGYEIALISGVDETKPGQLWQFRTKLSITDEDGKPVENHGIVYTGSKYTIYMEFQEKGPGGLQMILDEYGQLHYQLPNIFETTPMEQPLIVKIADENGQMIDVTIGTISVDEKGMVTVQVFDNYRGLFGTDSKIYDLMFSAKIEGTAGELQDGEDYEHKFDDAGEDFWVQVMDHPKVTAEKVSKFTEREDHSGGTLDYTVKTKVEHGQLNDGVITDVLTPPNNTDAFTLEMTKTEDGQPNVKVTLKRDGEDIELRSPDDYELVPDTDTPDGKQTFKVQLKGERCNPLLEGDELDVTYQYDATLKESSLNEFWGNVENDVTVTGYMPVQAPSKEGETTDIPVEEHAGSNVEIRVTDGGHGVVSKTQEYSEATHTLRYTLYTVIPAGEWAPLHIYDDMYVQYEDERWYLQEFREGGRVKNVKVYAKDVPNWVEGWDSLTDKQKAEYVENLGKEGAEEIEVVPFDGWTFPVDYTPDGPENMEQCARFFGGSSLYVIFGLEEPVHPESWNTMWGRWGHWNYETDRLIITEYDLDMSPGDALELSEIGGNRTLTLTPEQVLHAGITNNVSLRYSGYRPGYSVYFNNAEAMNKTGEVNAEDNTITWTVTMNTTDTTVNKYFRDVVADWMAQNTEDKYNWGNMTAAYSDSMQAVFYDELPDDWKYVEGSLTATACDVWGNKFSYPYDNDGQLKGFLNLVTQVGDKQVICTPLMFFYDRENTWRPNLFDWFGDQLASLTFTYKLKATDEWLEMHQYKFEGFPIDNHAEIKDKYLKHWEADAQVTYFPPQLTKEAEVIGKGMLKFKLEVNPQGVDLSKEDTLTVEDTSENLTIDPDTIEVTDADGKKVEFTQTVTDGHFELEVPDGMHLFITYLATINGDSAEEKISNTASINGVVGGDSSYSDIFDVNSMISGGSGSVNSMTVRKVDASDHTKQLEGAVFDYYMVLKEGDSLESTGEVEVGGTLYPCYHDKDMTVTTTTDGGKVSTYIGQGYYYIFVETKAPEGYVLDETPILVYFGTGLPDDAPAGTKLVEPRGGEYTWLTIPNTPKQVLQVVKIGTVGGEQKPLAGASFTIAPKKDDGTAGDIIYTGTSGETDGVVQWTKGGESVPELQLEDGTYILTETEAPAGFNKLDDPIEFKVENGKIVPPAEPLPGDVTYVETVDGEPVFQFIVPNPSGYVLPESGGMGTACLYVSGCMLLISAGLALMCGAKRRRTVR